MFRIFIVMTFMTAGLAYGDGPGVEEYLRSSQGLMSLIQDFEDSVQAECTFAEDASFYYDSQDGAQRSLVGVFECGELRSSPFVRVTGSVSKADKFELFKVVFINRP